ncbi:hypothetical protein HAX54_019061, partial [Datura stramonium]|nr:hypothetical protein [Datura stramonium]
MSELLAAAQKGIIEVSFCAFIVDPGTKKKLFLQSSFLDDSPKDAAPLTIQLQCPYFCWNRFLFIVVIQT